jgi:hypothetical protein
MSGTSPPNGGERGQNGNNKTQSESFYHGTFDAVPIPSSGSSDPRGSFDAVPVPSSGSSDPRGFGGAVPVSGKVPSDPSMPTLVDVPLTDSKTDSNPAIVVTQAASDSNPAIVVTQAASDSNPAIVVTQAGGGLGHSALLQNPGRNGENG